MRSFTRKQIIVLLTLCWLIALLCFGCTFYFVYVYIPSGNDNTAFCSPNDPVYQTLNANFEKWLSILPAENSVAIPQGQKWLQFIANDRRYLVQSEFWDNTNNMRVLRIVVDSGIGPGAPAEGLKGFIYSQYDPSKSYLSGYEFEALTPNIYCYWRKGMKPVAQD